MKKILTLILVLGAAVAALTSAAEVTVEGRTLSGVVVDRDTGEPIEFANVILRRLDHPEATQNTITVAEGRFRFEGLVDGHYRIDVLYAGMFAMREGFAVEGGIGEIEVQVELRSSSPRDPQRSDLQLVAADGVRILNDVELAAFVAGTDAPVRPPEGQIVRQFDEIAVEGAAIMVNTGEAESVGRIGSEDLTDQAVESVEKAVGRHSASIRRAVPLPTARSVADADPVTDEALARLARDSDELWILERPAAQPAPDADRGPGTGCLVVIQDDEEEVPVPLEHTDVHARIDGYIASVDVRQRFHNPFDETIEAEYLFPLPHDAAVNDFLMIVGERRIRGIIREKEEAREIYERARRAGHVASLLEQERPNVFRQRVANIEPGHAIEVELHYFNALPYRKGAFEFAFPLVVGPRFNPPGSEDPIAAVPRGTQAAGTAVSYLAPDERSGHDVSITVELDAGVSIEGLQSLNHATSVERDGGSRALVTLAPHDRIPNRDFVLSYRVASDAIKSGVLVHREGEEGYFSMMLVPPASLEQLRRAPVEFVFVLDCSGSMNGWPMEQSKAAMRRALRQLRPGDSFQVIRFSENASALGPAPVEATAANVERGLAYVDQLRGSGGTMMIEGIKAALDFPRDRERERIVSFMTDGYIGNEAEIFAAVAERIGGARIFSFGVGSSVNRHLVEGLARMGRGAVAYVGLQDDLQAVDEFYRIVRHPALTDVTVDWGAMAAKQVFPQQMHDLFVGRPLLLHGRFDGTGQTTVTVRGRAGGRTVEMAIDVDLDAIEKRESLPLLWARSEIGHISDQLARRSDDSLQSRGLDLALDYNLVSDWTSFVAVDASAVVDEPGTRTETVPVPVPEGVKYETTVKGNGR